MFRRLSKCSEVFSHYPRANVFCCDFDAASVQLRRSFGFLFSSKSFRLKNFSAILENQWVFFTKFLSIQPFLAYNCNFNTVIILHILLNVQFFIGWFSKSSFLFSFRKLFSSFGKPPEEKGWDNANRKRGRAIPPEFLILPLPEFRYFRTSLPSWSAQ